MSAQPHDDPSARSDEFVEPEGFRVVPAPPGFVREVGPFHLHDTRPVLALRIAAGHLNSLGIAHGGLLATLADTAFGLLLRRELGAAAPDATVSLQVDYLGAAREGDWLEAHVDLLKAGRAWVNASCMLRVDERPVLRSSGVFVRAEHLRRRAPTPPD